MDTKVIKLVDAYVKSKLKKTQMVPKYDIKIVWKCKTLQNWKYLVCTTLTDGMYYEVTYDGDKKRFYLDAYKKIENVTYDENGNKPIVKPIKEA